MHGSCRRVGVASCAFLTRLIETACVGITDVVAINLYTDTTTVLITVCFDGIVVPAPGTIVGVREIGLAPGAVELTILVPVADLREGNLTVGCNADDSLVVGRKIKEKPGITARSGQTSTGGLPIISDFVPQSDSDWAVGREGDGVIMAVGIAIAQR